MFFDRKPAAADSWTKETWVYDLRTSGRAWIAPLSCLLQARRVL